MVRIARLRRSDADQATRLFALMAEVFGEAGETLTPAYVETLLVRDDFWALAAFSGVDLVGGLAAHTLPMTRTESSEIFIYDIAVRPDFQRQGVGRQLLDDLRAAAAAIGCHDVFVAADDEDTHALDFYRALGGSAAHVTMFTFGRPSIG